MRTIELHPPLRALFCVVFITTLALSPAQPAYSANYTVNSLADTNDGTCNATNCTLREAITASNSTLYIADTIQFSVSGTITLTSSLPGIVIDNGKLTIDGAGQNIKINGDDSVRAFYLVASRSELVLHNLTIMNGFSGGVGGAIYNKGDLEIYNSKLINNRAGADGGAIYSQGHLTIADSDISSNSVDMGYGGAIFVYTNTTTTITSTMFMNNNAYVHGGAIYNAGHVVTEGTNFVLNSTDTGYGGAIFNTKNFVGNNVLLSFNSTPHSGGAFWNEAGALFQFSRCEFLYNSAGGDGGGVYADTATTSLFRACEFIENTAAINGGGIANHLGDIDIYSTTFKSNDAAQNGGAIYNQTGDLDILDSTLVSNTADQDGAGIYNLNHILITRSTFSGNHALGNGGGIYHDTGETFSQIINSTFYDNRAAKGGALYSLATIELINATIAGNRGSTAGSGIYGDDHTTIRNSIIANNLLSSNCGVDLGSPKPTNGGNNIDSASSCGFGSSFGSFSNINPLLGPLQLNGGNTETMALLAGSPAIDAVLWNTPNNCPDYDQRQFERPFGLRCDIGAIERYYRLFMPQVMKH